MAFYFWLAVSDNLKLPMPLFIVYLGDLGYYQLICDVRSCLNMLE